MKISDFAFAADGNYVEQLRVTVASLLHACRKRPRPLTIHVLDLGIPNDMWDNLVTRWGIIFPQASVRRHNISPDKYKEYKIWNGSVATYARLELPVLLPDVEWCFYFDCDTLIIHDPDELEPLCDPDAAIIGCRNCELATATIDGPWIKQRSLPFDPNKYVCAGVLLMNLRWFRQNENWKRCFDFLERYPNPVSVDQTVLNVVCNGHVGLLPDGWGAFPDEALLLGECGCVHYSGKPPWKFSSDWFYYCGEHKLGDVWRRFAKEVAGWNPPRKSLLTAVRSCALRILGFAITSAAHLAVAANIAPGNSHTKRIRLRIQAKTFQHCITALFD